ncbi:BolA family transcriptional regulator [Haloplanus salinus]|jgi:stress-induced morphogen|uniref:BolA family transcriptional regulator n=1 Tax=Haloplanus salinus TaxID=1126245 RepID=A0A368NEU0_9EURY|nr:BolA family protein [Haloplanus salinus]RCU47961.1 BolA family transcriptional regulator [Haloplanus salinus]
MDTADVERLIEDGIEDAEATVTKPRVPDEDHEDAHFAAVVVSPVFEGVPLVQQHEMVYEALDGYMTTDIHALEMKTYTPEAYAEHGDA